MSQQPLDYLPGQRGGLAGLWFIRVLQRLAVLVMLISALRLVLYGRLVIGVIVSMDFREFERFLALCSETTVPLTLGAILFVLCSLRLDR